MYVPGESKSLSVTVRVRSSVLKTSSGTDTSLAPLSSTKGMVTASLILTGSIKTP